MKPYYISIAGVIGVGKTTVARLLAKHFPQSVLFEEPETENPFLPLFYGDMKRWALTSQTFFLVKKIQLLRKAEKKFRAGRTIIQDTPIMQDVYSYAKAQRKLKNMLRQEFSLYKMQYKLLAKEIKQPDLTIMLTADMDHLQQRIRKRDRFYEKGISSEYLNTLNELNEKWFDKLDSKVKMKIHTNDLDIVSKKQDQKKLLQIIKKKLTI